MLHTHLVNEQSLTDPCVYTKITEHGKTIIIIWVDDIIIAASNETEMRKTKDSLS